MRSRAQRPSEPGRDRAPAGSREVALEQWRDAAKRVVRDYRAWQAAERCDRHHRYVMYLAALRAEEQAAQEVAQGPRAGLID